MIVISDAIDVDVALLSVMMYLFTITKMGQRTLSKLKRTESRTKCQHAQKANAQKANAQKANAQKEKLKRQTLKRQMLKRQMLKSKFSKANPECVCSTTQPQATDARKTDEGLAIVHIKPLQKQKTLHTMPTNLPWVHGQRKVRARALLIRFIGGWVDVIPRG